jgi:hypothetical protein
VVSELLKITMKYILVSGVMIQLGHGTRLWEAAIIKSFFAASSAKWGLRGLEQALNFRLYAHIKRADHRKIRQ